MKHNFEERKQKRIENARKKAKKNESLSEHFFVTAHQMASAIPFGQPILVGHHSEKRDRNYRNKIDNAFSKSVQADEKAKYYQQKAESIESNTAIFSDDPQALEKLRAELANLLAKQGFMKCANRCIKKRDKDNFLKLPGATEQIWISLTTPDYLNEVGYPQYKLANNNANIRRIKQRIAGLERIANRVPQNTVFAGGQLCENQNAGRIQFHFNEKPGEEIRKMLKGEGFRWSPRENAWQRHYNGNGIWAAKRALEKIIALEKSE